MTDSPGALSSVPSWPVWSSAAMFLDLSVTVGARPWGTWPFIPISLVVWEYPSRFLLLLLFIFFVLRAEKWRWFCVYIQQSNMAFSIQEIGQYLTIVLCLISDSFHHCLCSERSLLFSFCGCFHHPMVWRKDFWAMLDPLLQLSGKAGEHGGLCQFLGNQRWAHQDDWQKMAFCRKGVKMRWRDWLLFN